MLYHDHAQAAKMHKLLRYSGMECKNTETNIFVYGGKRVNSNLVSSLCQIPISLMLKYTLHSNMVN